MECRCPNLAILDLPALGPVASTLPMLGQISVLARACGVSQLWV
jgi:hypothetical protein